MYKCDFCGDSVNPNTRMRRVVTAYRIKDYHQNRDSRGYEIMSEAKACGSCAPLHAVPPPFEVVGKLSTHIKGVENLGASEISESR
jgi:hypothetical protein